MILFLFLIIWPTAFANPISVNSVDVEPPSDTTYTATKDDLGNIVNTDGTLDTNINQQYIPLATSSQNIQPDSPLAQTGTVNQNDQLLGLLEPNAKDSQDGELGNLSDQSPITPEFSVGSQDLVASANQVVSGSNQDSYGEKCLPGSASESNNLGSQENSNSCAGQLTQLSIPIDIPLDPFIRTPNIPALGTPGTETPVDSPKKKPYKKPTDPWPNPNSPIRTPVDENTCGPAEETYITLCCQGIAKYVKPEGVASVFSAIYSNLAIKARYDVDACIDYKENDPSHRCDHDGAVTCCKRRQEYPSKKPNEKILKDEFKGVDCKSAFPGAPDWPGKFKPNIRPPPKTPIPIRIYPPKPFGPKPKKIYDPDEYP